MMPSDNAAFDKAVCAAGGQVALGKALGVSQQSISKWYRRGWVSEPYAREIERRYAIPHISLLQSTVQPWINRGGAE